MSATASQEVLARQASFVFKGTVKKLKAATLPSVPVTDQTVIVRVDQVLQAPKLLSGYEGKDITVQLGKEKKLKEGEQAVFYTNSWLFGDSIAVQSVGHTEAGKSVTASFASESKSIKTKEDRDLREHLADADVVVRGRVVSVGLPEKAAARGAEKSAGKKGAKTGSTTHVSEHSARWNEAIVDVQSVEKGRPSRKQISVRFAGSGDVAWAKAPKLEPGQEGVFILHKAATEKAIGTSKRGSGAAKEGRQQSYVALHAHDFLPGHSAENVKALMQSAAPKKVSKKKR